MELETNRTNLSQVLVLFYLISWPLKLRIFTTWSSWWYPNVMFLFVFFKGMQLKWLKLFSSKFEKWHHENKVIEELCQQATVPSITRVRNNLIQWLSKKRHRTPETCFRIICVHKCTLKGANRPHMSAILVLGSAHVILNWPMIIVINSIHLISKCKSLSEAHFSLWPLDSSERPCTISKRCGVVEKANGTRFAIATKTCLFHFLLKTAITAIFW